MTAAPLPIVRTPEALQAALSDARDAGRTIGFVPTMGGLHEGHLSLVRSAKARADTVVASVFVNPTQFAPGEDFDAYPRQEARDAELLAGAGCDVLYAPTASTMYPDGFATQVTLDGPARGLESDARPHFFAGVATVVTKLLNQVRPTTAVFGEKDYQQLLVIRRLVLDLDLGVDIIAAPTEREPDGLALSSRNAYLDARAREIAGGLSFVLFALAADLAAGAPWRDAEELGRRALLDHGFEAVDYVAVRDAATLAAFEGEAISGDARILAAARVGDVRLIDNVPVARPIAAAPRQAECGTPAQRFGGKSWRGLRPKAARRP